MSSTTRMESPTEDLTLTVSQDEAVTTRRMTKKERAAAVEKKLAAINRTENVDVPRVCLDLSLGHLMNAKETSSLACQIRQVYGSNRRAQKPLQVWLTSLDTTSRIYTCCITKNDGFQKYMINMTDHHYSNMFPDSEIIYLTPDSPNTLSEIADNKVYVIGGLVDEQVLTNITYDLASAIGVTTASLPILRCMKHAVRGTFSKVLAINQVFDILLTYYNTQSWKAALKVGVPDRKGFIPR